MSRRKWRGCQKLMWRLSLNQPAQPLPNGKGKREREMFRSELGLSESSTATNSMFDHHHPLNIPKCAYYGVPTQCQSVKGPLWLRVSRCGPVMRAFSHSLWDFHVRVDFAVLRQPNDRTAVPWDVKIGFYRRILGANVRLDALGVAGGIFLVEHVRTSLGVTIARL